jgi:hypothetical protein
MNEAEIAQIVVDAASEVDRTLGGRGLLDAVIAEALVFELTSRGPIARERLSFLFAFWRLRASAPSR